MNLILWSLQVILAIKLLSATYTHGLRRDPVKMQLVQARFGAGTRPLLIVIALATLLGAVLLIFPGLIGGATAITAAAAAAVAVMMLVAIAFHLRCRNGRYFMVGLVLAAMAGFVAYGRWVLAPY
jgi:hypothetical protein